MYTGRMIGDLTAAAAFVADNAPRKVGATGSNLTYLEKFADLAMAKKKLTLPGGGGGGGDAQNMSMADLSQGAQTQIFGFPAWQVGAGAVALAAVAWLVLKRKR